MSRYRRRPWRGAASVPCVPRENAHTILPQGTREVKHLPVRDARGRIVGVAEGGVFRKDKLRGSVHMLRTPRGWALDLVSLSRAEELGCQEVLLTDCEAHTTYSASLETIRLYGIPVDRGCGPQLCLQLEDWSLNGARPRRAAIGRPEPPDRGLI